MTANSSYKAFLDRLCSRHALARETLLRHANAFAGLPRSREVHGKASELVGTYACYSHAWSPYFRGQLVRGFLSVVAAPGLQRLAATDTKSLPTGRLAMEGAITTGERALYLTLRVPDGHAQTFLCLYAPTTPASALGGFMSGATMIAPEPEPTVSRILMIRLPVTSAQLDPPDAYLPPGASPAGDLAALGVAVASPKIVDQTFSTFLSGGAGGGLDQIPRAAYREVVELFDRQWLGAPPPP